jgi:DNA-binding Lrp family transcriptional regulator
MLQQTSLEAFELIKPKINANQRIILDVIEGAACDMTGMEIAKYLGWSVNRVTPRVLELRQKGLLKGCGVRKCGVTGYNAVGWVGV